MDDSNVHFDFLEKIFYENFKKEIDQEENVWRTLPFFSATVAFELASVFQVQGRLPQLSKPVTLACAAIGLVFVLLLALMLYFLWQSVRKRKFSFPASETSILEFVIEEDVQGTGPQAEDPAARAKAIKAVMQLSMIDQWATSAGHNRGVNRLRAQFRERAAQFLLLSIGTLLILIVCVALDPLVKRTEASANVVVSNCSENNRDASGSDGFSHISRPRTTRKQPRAQVPTNAGRDDRMDL